MVSWARLGWGRAGALAARFCLAGCIAAIVLAPIAGVASVEQVRFSDRLGTLPVEVSLARNGVSTLDTGILGRVYWTHTGAGGFGAFIRVTSPPQAGGSLASYVDPRFVQANAVLIGDPGALAAAYGAELRQVLLRTFLRIELWIAVVGGLILGTAARRWSSLSSVPPAFGLAVAVSLLLSQFVAVFLLATWEGSDPVGESHALPEVDGLSFSSPEVLEIARQVRPFVEKNIQRIEANARAYEEAAATSLRSALPPRVDDLTPREGERLIVAEADPQGSLVGTRVRKQLYRMLGTEFGRRAFMVRTISGDVSSNGTVGERTYIALESTASPRIPTVAVKGDHDTRVTVRQLEGNGVIVPNLKVASVGGARVAAANDPAFKTLMGGTVINETGISEREAGAMLRSRTSGPGRTRPRVVLFHQPGSAAGYIGIPSLRTLTRTDESLTEPRDDGIPDLPPGTINVGHLHDTAGPWVIWNTDGEQVTWTVVSQLGTAGGVEEVPTFNRFSTPFSPPLKDLSVQLQYVRSDSSLQTGYADITFATDGTVTIGDRVDVGLADGQPAPVDEVLGERPQ